MPLTICWHLLLAITTMSPPLSTCSTYGYATAECCLGWPWRPLSPGSFAKSTPDKKAARSRWLRAVRCGAPAPDGSGHWPAHGKLGRVEFRPGIPCSFAYIPSSGCSSVPSGKGGWLKREGLFLTRRWFYIDRRAPFLFLYWFGNGTAFIWHVIC